jgi:hypothetical protein
MFTIADSLGAGNPFGALLSTRVDTAVFVCSFAWNFVLSAAISKLVFGRERRLSIQFFVSLGLTLLSSGLIEAFKVYGLDFSNPATMSLFSQIFGNPVFAFLYLALPFLFMIAIDLHLPKKLRLKL